MNTKIVKKIRKQATKEAREFYNNLLNKKPKWLPKIVWRKIVNKLLKV